MADFENVSMTLVSGREVELRPALPFAALVRAGLRAGIPDIVDHVQKLELGELKDPAVAFPVQDLMLQVMFVCPRVLASGEEAADGEITVDDLTDAELVQVLRIAMGEVADAATFRDDAGGDEDGDGGKSVGVKAKSRARSGTGKRGGVRAGS